MSISTKYVLDKRRAKGDKTFPLVMRVIINRKTIQVPTGYSLLTLEWDQLNQELKQKSKSIKETSKSANHFLATRKLEVREYISELRDKDLLHSTPYDQIKKRFVEILGGVVFHKLDFFAFAQSEIEIMRTALKFGTVAVYENLLMNLVKFWGRKVLPFSSINNSFLKRYEADHLNRGSKQGSLSIYLRTMRAVFNRAIKKGVVDFKLYPFKNFTIKQGTPKKTALSEKDFLTVMRVKLDDHSAIGIGRNYYMASFLMHGINWIDMCYLKRDNFTKDWKRVSYVRIKTGKLFNLSVEKDLIDIIMALRKQTPIGDDDYIFPVITDTLKADETAEKIKNRRKAINKYLKSLSKYLEIDPFTIYSARHTYATLARFNGTPVSIIQEDLGHKTEGTTRTYLKSFGNDEVDKHAKNLVVNLKKKKYE